MQSSLLGEEGEQKGMVGSCLKAAYTPARGFPSSLSCAVVSGVSYLRQLDQESTSQGMQE